MLVLASVAYLLQSPVWNKGGSTYLLRTRPPLDARSKTLDGKKNRNASCVDIVHPPDHTATPTGF